MYDLISVKKNLNVGDWEINSKTLALDTPHDWYVKKYTLHGGMQEGVEIIEVYNGKLTMKLIPTRGMNVLSVESDDLFLGWQSPVKQVVHPKHIDLNENGGLGWLYGFNEWMARCGIEFAGHPGVDDGRLLTVHGRVGQIPASEVRVEISTSAPYRISIIGEVEEVHFKFCNFLLNAKVSMELGSNTFNFDDTITNKATDEKEFMIIYHANFSNPILEDGAKLHGTIEKIMPFDQAAADAIDAWHQYGPPAKEVAGELVYCMTPRADDQGNAHFMMENKAGNKGIAFSYAKKQLPYFAQWKNPDSLTNGYVTGLEPSTGFPHNRAWERHYNRVPKLKGGQSRRFQISYSILSTQSDVNKTRTQIETLNKGKTITIERTPETDPRT